MNTIRYHIAVGLAVLAVALAGCKKDNPGIEPTPPPKPEPEVVTYTVTTRSESGNLEKGSDGKLETDKAVITGLGVYKAGETAKVVVSPKEGFVCDGLYFEYSSGYDASAFPTTAETALKVSEVSFEVKGNITIRAIVSKYEEPIVQPNYAKNVLVNEDYWRQKNQEAWAEIYPKIVRPTYEEATSVLGIKEAYPAMRPTEKTDTLYTEETAVMSWQLYPEWIDQQTAKTNKYLRRVAYALADEDGNMAEIYPPVIWDGCVGGAQGVRAVVFPTIPEGEYTEHILLNFAGDPNWYDLPIIELFGWENWEADGPDGPPMWPDLYNKLFTKYKPGDVMRQEDLFTSEKIRNRHVLRRNSSEKPPIPRWDSPRFYSGDNANGVYRKNEFITTHKDIRSTTVNLINGSNQYLRGDVVMVVRQKHWLDQNLDVIDHYEKTIIPARRDNLPLWGGEGTPGDLNEWSVEIGRVAVTIQPNATEQKIIIPSPFEEKLDGKLRFIFNFSDMSDQDAILFWVPEGTDKAYLMLQSNYRLLNYIETCGIPMTKWFSDCYTHPDIGHRQQIGLITDVFEDEIEIGNRIHLYGGI